MRIAMSYQPDSQNRQQLFWNASLAAATALHGIQADFATSENSNVPQRCNALQTAVIP